MTLDFNQIVESSVVNLKKSISSYNNLLNTERIEDFILNFHISLNQLMIAYCIKSGINYKYFKKSWKVFAFADLVGVIAKQGFFNSGERKFLETLNSMRNPLVHFFLSKDDINSKTNYIFLNSLIYLWQRMKEEIDGNILAESSLFLSPPQDRFFNDTEKKSNYINQIEILERNSLFKEVEKNLQVIVLKSSNWMENSGDFQEALSKIKEDTFPPVLFIKEIKKEIPSFSSECLKNITHVFAIRTDNWNYDNWNDQANKLNPDYVTKIELNNKLGIRYTKLYLKKVLEICKGNIDYADFFKKQFNKREHLDIDDFEWDTFIGKKSSISEENKQVNVI